MGRRNEIMLPESVHKELHKQFPSQLPNEQLTAFTEYLPYNDKTKNKKSAKENIKEYKKLLNKPLTKIYKSSARANNTFSENKSSNSLIQKVTRKQSLE